jgi:hypothetical protein
VSSSSSTGGTTGTDTPEFDDIKPYVNCKTLDEIEHVSIETLELLLNVVPDFVIHDFWQPEQQPYLHSLRNVDWRRMFDCRPAWSMH